MRRQRGQVAVFIALLSLVMVGFVGLVIDGGEVAATQQQVSAAADGAALAAGYGVTLTGASIGSATTLAADVMAQDGLRAAELTLTFYDSSGSVTASAGSVATVTAAVSHSMPTFFMQVMGVPNLTVSATSSSSVPAGGSVAPCALCVMASSGTAFTTGTSSVIQVSGAGLTMNSTGNPALSVGNNAAVTAPSIVIVGGHYSLGPGASVTPTPVTGAAASDPLATTAAPSISGVPSAYSSPSSGSGSIGPGVYSTITVNGTFALTLTAGTYVVENSVSVGGGSLTGSGVTLYLACVTYPTACLPGGAAGGKLSLSGGATTLTAPSSGTYAGIAVWADKNNNSTSVVSAGSLTVNGTFDTVLMPFRVSSTGRSMTFNGVVVMSAIQLANQTAFTVAAPSGSRGAGVALK